MPAVYTIPAEVCDRNPHLMRANGGIFDRERCAWRFRDAGDAAAAACDLYRASSAKLELKRQELRAMISEGTVASAWGYDEFASDIERVTHAQADELLRVGREARRVLGSRRLYLAREDDPCDREFDERARRSQRRSRERATTCAGA